MNGFKWPDARGWIGLGSYTLVVAILMLMWLVPDLRGDEFFKVIATAIVLTGWNQGPVGWAYQATKSGGELADRNAALIEKQSDTAARGAQPVKVVNDDAEPVPVDAQEAK